MYFVCFFMILYSIRHFWLGSRCIQEKSFTIQERWILSQHSDTIFRSPTFLASEIYTFVSCHYDVFCVFFHDIVLDSSFLTGFTLYTRKILHYTWKMNPFQHFDTIFRSSTSLASEIYMFVYWSAMYFVCFFMILYSIRHFWLGSRCIQEKSFTIQERWILSQHSDTIFRSPTFLASEIYTFVTCHYDVFCVFFHDIVLDSSFLTGFTLYTRKILHYTWKMNPFQHFDTIFRSSTSLASEIYMFVYWSAMYFVCFFMILYSIRHFWLGSRCIQEKSFTIHERWIRSNILTQFSDLQQA